MFDSRYTSIAAKHCKKHVDLKIDDTEYAVSRVCPGAAGGAAKPADSKAGAM